VYAEKQKKNRAKRNVSEGKKENSVKPLDYKITPSFLKRVYGSGSLLQK